MQKGKFRITCKHCDGSDILNLVSPQTVFFERHTPIIAARFRGDLQWGFQCTCGADSRLARSELAQADKLIVGPNKMTVDIVAQNISKNETEPFLMTAV